MRISSKLGLQEEVFARMCMTTKMLLSNVMGHAAESHYEKYLASTKAHFSKAGTDEHFDYYVGKVRDQVKRFETQGTSSKRLTINLTQTHGNRSGEGAFYEEDSFDRLIAFDVLFKNFTILEIDEIPRHPKFPAHLNSKVSIARGSNSLDAEQEEVLKLLKVKNRDFPDAMRSFLSEKKMSFLEGLEYFCNLDKQEIDDLFTSENFRLVTGAKGFAAEEHFNVFLESRGIAYKQDKDMYSKVDHWIGKSRFQVKIPHMRSVTPTHWAFKTHKSHGHGVGELYKSDEFDVVALFVGYKMEPEIDPYLPVEVANEFIFVPIEDLPEHEDFPGHLKRVSRIRKVDYQVNELNIKNL